MSDTAWRGAVRQRAATLIDPNLDFETRRSASLSLFELLGAAVGLNDGDPATGDAHGSRVTAGRAIPPHAAAACIRDYARTGKFLRGVRDAINAVARTSNGEAVRVLYAGCGPFATLALPIAHEWTPSEVSFTLLDYHQRSLDAARHLATRLGVLDRIADFVQVDASTYRCPDDRRPHVLVTETMRRALASEPQVAITRQLAPQLLPGGILVPERVTLHATLVDPGKEFAFGSAPLRRERRELGWAMILDKYGARFGTIVWPGELPERLDPFIRTHVRVRHDICLEDYESGLTGLTPMPLDRRPNPGEEVRFSYEFEPDPRLVTVIGPGASRVA